MTETNDYEKAKQECWEQYWASAKVIFKGDAAKTVCEDAFSNAFSNAYQLGKEQAEADRDAEILKTHLRVERYLGEKRLQVAAMAMQGLLSNQQGFQIDNEEVPKSVENVAIAAVAYANALIEQLNRKEYDAEDNQ